MDGTFKVAPEHVYLVADRNRQCWAKANTENEAIRKLKSVDPNAQVTDKRIMHESAYVDDLGRLMVAETHTMDSCDICRVL